jgi:hypothetical protein
MSQNEEVPKEENINRYTKYKENNKEKVKETEGKYRDTHREILAEKQRLYRQNNKEKIKQYLEKNKERIAERKKEYTVKNREQIAQYKKEYVENNKEKIAQYYKEYREKNKEKFIAPYTCTICDCQLQIREKSRHNKSKKHENYVKFVKLLNDNNIDRKNIKQHYGDIVVDKKAKQTIILDEINIDDQWHTIFAKNVDQDVEYKAYNEKHEIILCIKCE